MTYKLVSLAFRGNNWVENNYYRNYLPIMDNTRYNYNAPVPANLPKPTSSGTLEGPPPKRYRPNNFENNPAHVPNMLYQQPDYGQYAEGYYGMPQLGYAPQWQHAPQYAYPYYLQPPQVSQYPHIVPQMAESIPNANHRNTIHDIVKKEEKGDVLKASLTSEMELKETKGTRIEENEDNEVNNCNIRTEHISDDEIDGTAGDDSLLIPGTSISLKTEDDIAKWREDRRKMWLVKISNNKEKHKKDMNIEDKHIASSPLVQVKKEKNFINSIQNQVNRYNPQPRLNLGLVQRSMASENSKLLGFIKQLGEAKMLEYVLTDKEKDILFGRTNKIPFGKNGNNNHNNRPQQRNFMNNRTSQSRYNR
ncbi:HER069Cp [Eremothecium sinecaudum]|uniref:HER069Cp n=1 Tax=Eremothecium sinecaudum TaxID=45286 RepID=A0A109UZU4_9SACH|nr:HER069Cp [Eremothecium sinecaudum]AMD21348.1 HER069Cp [Eremothecium sinecaudum]